MAAEGLGAAGAAPEIVHDGVRAQLDAHGPRERALLERLRALVFETAAAHPLIGPIEETLKWREPAYLPRRARTGTTVRLNAVKGRPGACALYFHCQTTLVDEFRAAFPGAFETEGTRALVFSVDAPLPEAEIKVCLSRAFTYHMASSRPLNG